MSEFLVVLCLLGAWILSASPQKLIAARSLHRIVNSRRLILFALALLVVFRVGPAIEDLWKGTGESNSPLSSSPLSSTRNSEPQDAIVVLAGTASVTSGSKSSEPLPTASLNRLFCGITLWKKGFAPRLVLLADSGRKRQDSAAGTEAMRDLAINLGTPAHAVSIRDPLEWRPERANGAEGRYRNVSGIFLIAPAEELPRTVQVFRDQGIDVTLFSCEYEAQHGLVNNPGLPV